MLVATKPNVLNQQIAIMYKWETAVRDGVSTFVRVKLVDGLQRAYAHFQAVFVASELGTLNQKMSVKTETAVWDAFNNVWTICRDVFPL